jgi:hypothetical protein
MKILVNVNREIWGKVKFFATVKGLCLNSAVDYLLDHALEELSTFRPKMEARTN